MTVPPPVHADTESAADAVLRSATAQTPAHIVVDVAAVNSLTNAFELRFATSTNVCCATIDRVIGFDNGVLYTRDNDVASLTNIDATISSGPVSFRLDIAFDSPSPDAAPVSVTTSRGFEFLVPLVRASHPARWRGLRAISRRSGSQPTVTTAVTPLYFYMRVR